MAPPLEISIPTTSLHTPPSSDSSGSSNSKPYTLYNITLRLPLRSFVVQKRYSEFAALHAALTAAVGSPPPAPLPAKSWFRSTVSSPALTEQRRAGLERYLRAIAEPPDRRWRDAPAWRAFLNLPGGGGGGATGTPSASGISVNAAARLLPAVGTREATLAAASDPATWVDLHKEMKGLLKGARAALERKESSGLGVAEQMEAGTEAKKELIKAGSLLFALADGLGVMKGAGRLGEGELRRRRDLLAAAKEEKAWLDQWALRSRGGREQLGGVGGGSASESDRVALGVGEAARRPVGRTIGKPLQETERTRELDNAGVLQLQKEEMKLQDERVNEVGLSVQRLKANAIAIDEELTYQLGQLDHLNDLVDSHERKLAVANRRVKGL